jgi:hypothetical protein
VVTDIDARGQAIYTAYDALNRRTEQRKDSATGERLAAWSYDAAGQKGLLSSASRFTGGAEYKVAVTGYDARDRVTGRTWTIPAAEQGLAGSYTAGYAYDPADHVTATTSPAVGGLPAETITTAYTDQGYPATVAGAATYVAATQFTATGQLAGRTLGTGWHSVQRAYGYEPDTRRLASTAAISGGTNVEDDRWPAGRCSAATVG